MVTVGQFHKLWHELHSHARFYVPQSGIRNPQSEIDWLAKFARRIRCAGCRRHWLAIVAKHPPDFTSRATYFRWTVLAHNEINKMLGKPTLRFRDACKLYSTSAFPLPTSNFGRL